MAVAALDEVPPVTPGTIATTGSRGQATTPHRLAAAVATVILLTAASAKTAKAHVAPSVNENNRYVKLTVFGDRVRLAYILYIGEIPGQAARQRLDKDGDGLVSEGESASFRDRWAKQVAASLHIEVAGQELPVHWSRAEVGLGDPRTSAGAFSLDLVAWLCPASGATELSLSDDLHLPEPGETELLAEESPGVAITRAVLGGEEGTRFRWTGAGGPIEEGFQLAWKADADAPPAPGRCSEPGGDQGPSAWRWWPLAAVGAALVAVLAALVIIKRRRKS